MHKLTIVLDLDDTMFDTEVAMTNWINQTLDSAFMWKNRLSRTDPVEGPYLEKVLADGNFMAAAEFCKGFEHLPVLLREMQVVFKDYINFMFSTHRGYHPNASEFTAQQFSRLGLELEGVFLDPVHHPCKKTWLDENLPGPWVLFDDNPHWNGANDAPVNNIFLMDKPWNQAETSYERIFSYAEFKQKLMDVIMQFIAR